MIDMAEKAVPPAAPASGRVTIYAKAADHVVYVLSPSGVEVPINTALGAQILTTANLLLMGF